MRIKYILSLEAIGKLLEAAYQTFQKREIESRE